VPGRGYSQWPQRLSRLPRTMSLASAIPRKPPIKAINK
jgi:hypothetical protein